MNDTELAKKCHCVVSTISRIVRGETIPQDKLRCRIAIDPAVVKPSGAKEDEADALFPDIPADLWGGKARAMALRLAELGALSGYEDGAFRPQQPLSRIEGVSLVYRALALLGKVAGG
ncbi:MAG: S-layer homology domain-containing protein [Coprothermobacterota bacterium]|nr:S-layer homology domain-containing protein [Coprothermobacterota bacterium]